MTNITITLINDTDVANIAVAYNATPDDVPRLLSQHAQQMADAIANRDGTVMLKDATAEQIAKARPDLVAEIVDGEIARR